MASRTYVSDALRDMLMGGGNVSQLPQLQTQPHVLAKQGLTNYDSEAEYARAMLGISGANLSDDDRMVGDQNLGAYAQSLRGRWSGGASGGPPPPAQQGGVPFIAPVRAGLDVAGIIASATALQPSNSVLEVQTMAQTAAEGVAYKPRDEAVGTGFRGEMFLDSGGPISTGPFPTDMLTRLEPRIPDMGRRNLIPETTSRPIEYGGDATYVPRPNPGIDQRLLAMQEIEMKNVVRRLLEEQGKVAHAEKMAQEGRPLF